MKTVGVREARRRLGELVDAAERGESVIITRRGRQVARLGPVAPEGGRRLPDLSEFRARIRVQGKPLSETVAELRREEASDPEHGSAGASPSLCRPARTAEGDS